MKNTLVTYKDFGTNITPRGTNNEDGQIVSAIAHIQDIETRGGTMITLDKYRKALDAPQRIFFAAMVSMGIISVNAVASEKVGQTVYETTGKYGSLFVKDNGRILLDLDKLPSARRKFEVKLLKVIAKAMNAKANNKGAKNV